MLPLGAMERFPGHPARRGSATVFSAAAALLFLLAAAGCTDVRYEQYRTTLKTGDEVPLYEWPDSAYIAGIDAMLAAEVLTDEARKADVAITIDPRHPAVPPKGMGHAGLGGVPAPEFARPVADAPKAERRTAAARSGNAPAQSRPHFAEEFLAALDKMAADPRKGVVAQPLAGENLERLLVRQYGPEAKALPMGVVSYQLKLMNPGTDLERLVPGETVLLPRL